MKKLTKHELAQWLSAKHLEVLWTEDELYKWSIKKPKWELEDLVANNCDEGYDWLGSHGMLDDWSPRCSIDDIHYFFKKIENKSKSFDPYLARALATELVYISEKFVEDEKTRAKITSAMSNPKYSKLELSGSLLDDLIN